MSPQPFGTVILSGNGGDPQNIELASGDLAIGSTSLQTNTGFGTFVVKR